jgi:SPP1 gp7 family putative phage head morphogenesis protein
LLDLGLVPDQVAIFTQDVIAELQRQELLLAGDVNKTTRKLIMDQVSQGVARGEGSKQIEKRIRGVFKTRRKRAQTIARTEVLKANQRGQLIGFEESGVVEQKRWNTSRDDIVRKSHRIDGQVRLLCEPFELRDGEFADAPGIGVSGTRLSPHNGINCRCFVTPVVEV